MQRRLRLIPITLLAMLMALPHGAALHCNGDVTAIPVAAETIYVDDRSAFGSPIPYIYLESNGSPGLQTGGAGEHCLDDGPTCMWVNSLFRYDPCEHPYPDSYVY